MKKTMNICITGAAGQIAYSFIPQLLKGNVLPHVYINLKLLDIPQAENVLKGVILQIIDSTYPLLQSVEATTDPKIAFKNADLIVFLGGFPRKPGMQRKDLLQMNKNIFVEQSIALAQANPDVKCVVIANPANTNAYILNHYNKNIKKQNITCLTRLDHNRAIGQIVNKVKCQVQDVQGVFVFGNHSLTQYPCIKHIKVKGKPIQQIVDSEWLEKTFITTVQKRGGEVLAVRGGSSVFSAANAVIDHIRDWYNGSDKIISMGVCSEGQYGIPKGIWSSFPVRCENFTYKIVEGIQLSQFCKQQITKTCNQLQEQIQLTQID